MAKNETRYRVARQIRIDGEDLEPGTVLKDVSMFVRIEALVRSGKLEMINDDDEVIRLHRGRHVYLTERERREARKSRIKAEEKAAAEAAELQSSAANSVVKPAEFDPAAVDAASVDPPNDPAVGRMVPIETLQLPKPEPEPEAESEAEPEAAAKPSVKDVPEGTITEVLEWVGQDEARAKKAIHVEERRDPPRITLLESLNRVIEEQQ